jgi:protein-S-isoprenylcysteine O-methyltransferase Ste14
MLTGLGRCPRDQPTHLERVECLARPLGALAGLAALAAGVHGFWRAQSRPAGRETGAAPVLLRRPVLLVATLLFVAAGARLWRPLPLQLADRPRRLALVVGAALYFGGLALYVWGRRTLDDMFNVASGFGVRLHAGHRLVTTGPYRHVRHPMYLAVIVSGWGGLLLYRTWSMALFAISMLGLMYRAGREEQALAQEFGQEWVAYARRVPAWVPRVSIHRQRPV